MYAITYTLLTGTVLHRARSATDALEAMQMLKNGGAVVPKISATKTGEALSIVELQMLARAEEHPVR